ALSRARGRHAAQTERDPLRGREVIHETRTVGRPAGGGPEPNGDTPVAEAEPERAAAELPGAGGEAGDGPYFDGLRGGAGDRGVVVVRGGDRRVGGGCGGGGVFFGVAGFSGPRAAAGGSGGVGSGWVGGFLSPPVPAAATGRVRHADHHRRGVRRHRLP